MKHDIQGLFYLKGLMMQDQVGKTRSYHGILKVELGDRYPRVHYYDVKTY